MSKGAFVIGGALLSGFMLFAPVSSAEAACSLTPLDTFTNGSFEVPSLLPGNYGQFSKVTGTLENCSQRQFQETQHLARQHDYSQPHSETRPARTLQLLRNNSVRQPRNLCRNSTARDRATAQWNDCPKFVTDPDRHKQDQQDKDTREREQDDALHFPRSVSIGHE